MNWYELSGPTLTKIALTAAGEIRPEGRRLRPGDARSHHQHVAAAVRPVGYNSGHGMRSLHRGHSSLLKWQGTKGGPMSSGSEDYTYAGEKPQAVSLEGARVRFDERGLVPCVVQQAGTGEVLMVAWMSEESLRLTLETGTTWFWSRSRQELWNKGATSGNMQQVRRLLVDCDADTLLVEVDSPGPACHTGHRSCFFREISR